MDTEESAHTLAVAYFKNNAHHQAYYVLSQTSLTLPLNKYLFARCCCAINKCVSSISIIFVVAILCYSVNPFDVGLESCFKAPRSRSLHPRPPKRRLERSRDRQQSLRRRRGRVRRPQLLRLRPPRRDFPQDGAAVGGHPRLSPSPGVEPVPLHGVPVALRRGRRAEPQGRVSMRDRGVGELSRRDNVLAELRSHARDNEPERQCSSSPPGFARLPVGAFHSGCARIVSTVIHSTVER